MSKWPLLPGGGWNLTSLAQGLGAGMGTEGRLVDQGQPWGRQEALPSPRREEEKEGNSQSPLAGLGSRYLLASSLELS